MIFMVLCDQENKVGFSLWVVLDSRPCYNVCMYRPVVTDNGNFLLDVDFGLVDEPEKLNMVNTSSCLQRCHPTAV